MATAAPISHSYSTQYPCKQAKQRGQILVLAAQVYATAPAGADFGASQAFQQQIPTQKSFPAAHWTAA